MYIKKIKVKNFRNYKNQELELDKNINIIYGDNAQGKTNILEAIFLSAFGKSFRTSKDKELINKNEDFSNIEINYKKKDREGKININISDKKVILVNDIKINKLSELLGNVNIVIFTPDDMSILKDGPSKRRKFLNMMIGQLRSNYLYNLNMYDKTLEQRNNYLKQNASNIDMLEIWDEKLAEYGSKVYEYRAEFINKIKEKIGDIHKDISPSEEIKIHYISDCENKEKYLNKLISNRNIDLKKGYTSVGIHRDDFKVFINGEEVNIYGSQGQNRTAILSLKMTELNIIYEDIGEAPILLLDDFMSELDEKRISNFLKNIKDIQVIITCTKKLQMKNATFYNVVKGEIT